MNSSIPDWPIHYALIPLDHQMLCHSHNPLMEETYINREYLELQKIQGILTRNVVDVYHVPLET